MVMMVDGWIGGREDRSCGRGERMVKQEAWGWMVATGGRLVRRVGRWSFMLNDWCEGRAQGQVQVQVVVV
jgi:hypothetical protein